MFISKRALPLALVCTSLLVVPMQAGNNKDDSRSRLSPDYKKAKDEVGGKNLSQWAKDLSSADASVRADAIMVLPFFGEDAAYLVPKLCTMAQTDNDASPRAKVMMALQLMFVRNTDLQRVVESLSYCIGNDNQTVVRYLAAKALPRFATFGEAGQKALTRNIHHILKGASNLYCWEVREASIQVLRVAGVDPEKGPDPRVTDVLISHAGPMEKTWKVRLQAIMALGGMGRPQDPKKLADIMRVLKQDYNAKSPNKAIRIWSHVAVMALEDQTNEKYMETLAEYTKDHVREIRFQAVSSFGALGDLGHKHIMRVVERLNEKTEKEPLVVQAACNSLAKMGDHSDRVLKALIAVTEREGVHDKVIPCVVAACSALGHLGTGKPEVLVALNKAMNRKDVDEQDKDAIKKAIDEYKKPKMDEKRKAKTGGAKKEQEKLKKVIKRR